MSIMHKRLKKDPLKDQISCFNKKLDQLFLLDFGKAQKNCIATPSQALAVHLMFLFHGLKVIKNLKEVSLDHNPLFLPYLNILHSCLHIITICFFKKSDVITSYINTNKDTDI